MIKDHELPALRQRFRTVIRDELGLSRFNEEDGDFQFRYEGMNISLIFDDDDAAFVWIVMFALHWVKAEDVAAVAVVDQAINEANYKVKAVKLVRDKEPDKDGEYGVHASVAFLAEDVASQSDVALERYLGQIKSGARVFKELVGKAADNPAAVQCDAVRH
jgi:hypothetical protein